MFVGYEFCGSDYTKEEEIASSNNYKLVITKSVIYQYKTPPSEGD